LEMEKKIGYPAPDGMETLFDWSKFSIV
jgi:hypothetical protein